MRESNSAEGQRRGPMSHVELQILLLLSLKASHGYEMMKEISRLTDGEIDPGPGTLYVALRRLADDGSIRQVGKTAKARARRKYGITKRGRSALNSELERLAKVLQQARRAGWDNPLGESV